MSTAGRSGMVIALTMGPLALHAQTSDEARLVVGMAAGYIGSAQLWAVPRQPMQSLFGATDVFNLRRRTRSDITVNAQATYFGRAHLGVTGEFTYLGLANSDDCSLVQDSGDGFLTAACDALNGNSASATIVTVGAGLVYRPFSHTRVQPYFKGVVGLAFTPISTIEMQSQYGSVGDTALVTSIYTDDSWKAIRASWTLGFGLSTAPSSGYQLHLEVRETWIPLGEVTGPSALGVLVPPQRTAIKAFPSVLVGFDIVLAKRRGRRY